MIFDQTMDLLQGSAGVIDPQRRLGVMRIETDAVVFQLLGSPADPAWTGYVTARLDEPTLVTDVVVTLRAIGLHASGRQFATVDVQSETSYLLSR